MKETKHAPSIVEGRQLTVCSILLEQVNLRGIGNEDTCIIVLKIKFSTNKCITINN